MSLLLDQNLSRHLVTRLADVCPNLSHVALAWLDRASDEEVLAFARSSGRALVSKDSDFADLVSLSGAPPKVIWLRLGNCSTREVAAALRAARATVMAFLEDADSTVLELI